MRTLETSATLLERLYQQPFGERPSIAVIPREEIKAKAQEDTGLFRMLFEDTGALYDGLAHRVYLPQECSPAAREWYLAHETTHAFMRNNKRLMHAEHQLPQSPSLRYEQDLIIKAVEEGTATLNSMFIYTLANLQDAEIEEESEMLRTPLKANMMLEELRQHFAMVHEGCARNPGGNGPLLELNDAEKQFLEQHSNMEYAAKLLAYHACFYHCTSGRRGLPALLANPPLSMSSFETLLRSAHLI